MGRSCTSFRPGEGGRRPGTKNKKTRVKEIIGIENFEAMEDLTVLHIQELLEYPFDLRTRIKILGALTEFFYGKPKPR